MKISLINIKNTYLHLFTTLVFTCLFFSTPTLALAQVSETDSLLNASHVTSWAYFRDPSKNQWYIANNGGVTYFLSANNYRHAAWGSIAQDAPVAAIDFNLKKVLLSANTAAPTLASTFLTKSLVKGEVDEYVLGSAAKTNAELINGQSLDLDWYFFQVESTKIWYIVSIPGINAKVWRLNLSADKSNYDWKNPTNNSLTEVDTTGWNKEFFKENAVWKVRFSAPVSGLIFPFSRTNDWQICQGYNTSSVSHIGTLVYSFDFAYGLGNQGSTACFGTDTISENKPYLAPANGVIGGRDFGNDTDVSCLVLDTPVPNGSGSTVRSVEMGHMKSGAVNRRVDRGTRLYQGNTVGLLCAANGCNSVGAYAHAHMGVYTSADCSGTSVPFGTVFGTPYDFTSNGTKYQWHTTNILRN
jgi:hypothetical protein